MTHGLHLRWILILQVCGAIAAFNALIQMGDFVDFSIHTVQTSRESPSVIFSVTSKMFVTSNANTQRWHESEHALWAKRHEQHDVGQAQDTVLADQNSLWHCVPLKSCDHKSCLWALGSLQTMSNVHVVLYKNVSLHHCRGLCHLPQDLWAFGCLTVTLHPEMALGQPMAHKSKLQQSLWFDKSSCSDSIELHCMTAQLVCRLVPNHFLLYFWAMIRATRPDLSSSRLTLHARESHAHQLWPKASSIISKLENTCNRDLHCDLALCLSCRGPSDGDNGAMWGYFLLGVGAIAAAVVGLNHVMMRMHRKRNE